MNSHWAEQYAKQHIAELTSEARGDLLIAASRKRRRTQPRTVSSALSGRLIARFSAAVARLRSTERAGAPTRSER